MYEYLRKVIRGYMAEKKICIVAFKRSEKLKVSVCPNFFLFGPVISGASWVIQYPGEGVLGAWHRGWWELILETGRPYPAGFVSWLTGMNLNL